MKLKALALLCALTIAAPVSAHVSLFVRAGGSAWAALAWLPEGPALVRSNDAAVLVETPARLVWAVGLPEPILYLDATYCAGEVWAVGQGRGTGAALVIRESGVRAVGPSFGQNATAIACVTDRPTLYTQFSPTEYAVSDLVAMTTEVRTMAATSQGFRDVLDSGEVRRGDDWFYLPNQYGLGRPIHQPVERQRTYVGQNSEGAGILTLRPDRAFTAIPGEGFEAKVQQRGDVIAVKARTPAGAALAIITPPYPPHEPRTPPVEPPVPPVEPPPPQLPDCAAGGGDGLQNGVVVDVCRWFFNVLVAGRPATSWDAILREVEPRLWGKGFGQQRGSGTPTAPGGVRGRLYLPTAICPNAAPLEEHQHRGVRFDERCWEGLGRRADVVENGNRWIWNEGGPQAYVPFTGGGPIDPPPTSDLDKRVAALETELRHTQAALNGVTQQAQDLSNRVRLLEDRPNGGALTPAQLQLLEGVRQFLDLLKNGFSTNRADQILPHSHTFRWEPAR